MAQQLTAYPVWDRTVRIFHWVNVLCVLVMIAVGVAILNDKALGVTNDGKLLLKTIHVYVGYVFAINLSWRLIWGFLGNRYARLKSILPFNAEHRAQLTAMRNGLKTGKPIGFLGHNPIARLMVGLLFVIMSAQAITGLVLAGTDVYMPPFGNMVKESIAIGATAAEFIKPYSKDGIDEVAYKEMRDFRKPFITVHYYAFYTLLAAIFLHLLGVVVTEIREKNGIISAMFTGSKVFAEKPFDAE